VKKILISAALALMLVAAIAMPAVAADTQSVGASVTVGAVISITLTDAGTSGINFGPVQPDDGTHGDVDQSSGTPAIKVVVGAETNTPVDIQIMGSTAGTLGLSNWKYSKLFNQSDIASLTGSYVAVYTNVAAGSSNDFYHWVTVPSTTQAGSYSATVSYKAVVHS
jgi:hypothetical protein